MPPAPLTSRHPETTTIATGPTLPWQGLQPAHLEGQQSTIPTLHWPPSGTCCYVGSLRVGRGTTVSGRSQCRHPVATTAHLPPAPLTAPGTETTSVVTAPFSPWQGLQPAHLEGQQSTIPTLHWPPSGTCCYVGSLRVGRGTTVSGRWAQYLIRAAQLVPFTTTVLPAGHSAATRWPPPPTCRLPPSPPPALRPPVWSLPPSPLGKASNRPTSRDSSPPFPRSTGHPFGHLLLCRLVEGRAGGDGGRVVGTVPTGCRPQLPLHSHWYLRHHPPPPAHHRHPPYCLSTHPGHGDHHHRSVTPSPPSQGATGPFRGPPPRYWPTTRLAATPHCPLLLGGGGAPLTTAVGSSSTPVSWLVEGRAGGDGGRVVGTVPTGCRPQLPLHSHWYLRHHPPPPAHHRHPPYCLSTHPGHGDHHHRSVTPSPPSQGATGPFRGPPPRYWPTTRLAATPHCPLLLGGGGAPLTTAVGSSSTPVSWLVEGRAGGDGGRVVGTVPTGCRPQLPLHSHWYLRHHPPPPAHHRHPPYCLSTHPGHGDHHHRSVTPSPPSQGATGPFRGPPPRYWPTTRLAATPHCPLLLGGGAPLTTAVGSSSTPVSWSLTLTTLPTDHWPPHSGTCSYVGSLRLPLHSHWYLRHHPPPPAHHRHPPYCLSTHPGHGDHHHRSVTPSPPSQGATGPFRGPPPRYWPTTRLAATPHCPLLLGGGGAPLTTAVGSSSTPVSWSLGP
ncbi:hypothetical protein TYRP_010261 [Tyrophagus putrescentiae]|nr:hypothetical protein TYRP_010261 [Tyrophagus putrescentiae]